MEDDDCMQDEEFGFSVNLPDVLRPWKQSEGIPAGDIADFLKTDGWKEWMDSLKVSQTVYEQSILQG